MKKIDIKTRILKNIEIDDNGCWLLKFTKSNKGYAQMYVGNKNKSAHRVSYETFVGPIPKGLLVLHHCDIRHCVNPAHLWLGTAKDNTKDMVLKRRHTARFNDEQVKEIRKLYSSGECILKDLAEMFNVSQTSISNIVRFKTYSILK